MIKLIYWKVFECFGDKMVDTNLLDQLVGATIDGFSLNGNGDIGSIYISKDGKNYDIIALCSNTDDVPFMELGEI